MRWWSLKGWMNESSCLTEVLSLEDLLFLCAFLQVFCHREWIRIQLLSTKLTEHGYSFTAIETTVRRIIFSPVLWTFMFNTRLFFKLSIWILPVRFKKLQCEKEWRSRNCLRILLPVVQNYVDGKLIVLTTHHQAEKLCEAFYTRGSQFEICNVTHCWFCV